MILAIIRAVVRAFLILEAENQELFQTLKNTLLGGILGFVTIVTLLVTVEVDLIQFALYSGVTLLAIFVLLVFYRCWEFIKYELEIPGQ
ncbi:hypothetical protein HTZ84_05325 [Haloterrigena sp. SYSU A558-1]|uniref:Uncharacterized protein n=1 Tax=Haloterrigena gelatinilytica TaxID=2741724 RepID=A0ABX2L8M0_9EURY|nr:hypothetical protein [Haloterrigena gelatinilytica]NUC71735.1 hypothetical protein [Haloterrigena gelatinilytica]